SFLEDPPSSQSHAVCRGKLQNRDTPSGTLPHQDRREPLWTIDCEGMRDSYGYRSVRRCRTKGDPKGGISRARSLSNPKPKDQRLHGLYEYCTCWSLSWIRYSASHLGL